MKTYLLTLLLLPLFLNVIHGQFISGFEIFEYQYAKPILETTGATCPFDIFVALKDVELADPVPVFTIGGADLPGAKVGLAASYLGNRVYKLSQVALPVGIDQSVEMMVKNTTIYKTTTLKRFLCIKQSFKLVNFSALEHDHMSASFTAEVDSIFPVDGITCQAPYPCYSCQVLGKSKSIISFRLYSMPNYNAICNGYTNPAVVTFQSTVNLTHSQVFTYNTFFALVQQIRVDIKNASNAIYGMSNVASPSATGSSTQSMVPVVGSYATKTTYFSRRSYKLSDAPVLPTPKLYMFYESNKATSIVNITDYVVRPTTNPPFSVVNSRPLPSQDDMTPIHYATGPTYPFPLVPLLPMILRFKSNSVDNPLSTASLSFPFGVGSGTVNKCLLSLDFQYSRYNPSIAFYLDYYSSATTSEAPGSPGSDTLAPQILDFQWIPFGAYSFVVRVTAQDNISGVFQVLIGSTVFGYVEAKRISDSESGTLPAIFEAIVTLGDTIIVRDYAYMQVKVVAPNYIVGNSMTWIGNAGVPHTSSEDDITDLYFRENEMDVTNKTADNILYFTGGLGGDPTYKPILMLFPESMSQDTILKRPDLQFTGYYDSQTGYYAIPFTLKMNEFEGPVQYNLVLRDFISPNSKIFTRKFGSRATLSIISKNADVLPAQVYFIYAKKNVDIPANDDGVVRYVSWDLNIGDDYNGFEEGYVDIFSDLNPVPVRIPLDNTTYQFGDSFTLPGAKYTVKVPLPAKGVNQMFQFTAYLRDKAGNIAISNSTEYIDPMNRVATFADLKVNVTYASPLVDDVAPELVSFQVSPAIIDVGSLNRNITVDLVVKDNADIYYKNAPIVYLSSVNNILIAMPSQYLGSNATGYSYRVNFELPYAFGSLTKLFLSCYGIYDTSFNMVGYSNKDLLGHGFISNISRSFSNGPYLESHSKVSQAGGQVSIYGRSFGLYRNQSTVNVVTIDANQTVLGSDLAFHSGIVFVFNLPAFTSTIRYYNVTITVDNKLSNMYLNHLNVLESLHAMVTEHVNLVHVFAQPIGLVLIAQLDPNFSLLIDTDTSNDYDTICGGSSKKGLGAAKLAGIIIGSVAIVVVITIVVVYFKFKTMKARKENKAMQHKLARLQD
eukprot:gene11014-12834_t